MKQITAADFEEFVEADPAWAAKLTEPVEITDYCDMSRSNISHLSPLLHFTGTDINKNCARFWMCQSLKNAEGTFHGFVEFGFSSIEKIGQLTITQPNNKGEAANFYKCKDLKVAEGNFTGFVSFNTSNIQRVGKLTIKQTRQKEGKSANFEYCDKLTLNKAWLERTDVIIDEDIRNRSGIQLRHEAAVRKAMKQPSFEL